MARPRSQEKETRLQSIVNYLLENYRPDYANAVERAASEVTLALQNEAYTQKFSRKLNKQLTEALIMMNCDNDCSTKQLAHLRKLIESYHEIHGLDGEDYYAGNDIDDAEVVYGQVPTPEVPEEEDWMPQGEEEYDMEEECGGDLCDCILDTVEIGEVRTIDAIAHEVNEEDTLAVLDAVRELVKDGYFEVREREPYNGYISSVLRVR